MSGFVLQAGVGDPDAVSAMADAISHRGDGRTPVRTGTASLALLNRRDGAFTASAACVDGVTVMLEGWLQDTGPLRAEHADQPLPGALAREYRRKGAAALADLRGAFVVAVLDQSTRRVLLHRDVQGQRPGYYWSDGRTFLAASEVKAIARHPAYRGGADSTVLAHLMVTGVEPHDRSLASGIRKIPPGHLVEWTEDATPATRVLANVEVPIGPPDVEAAADRLGALLEGEFAHRLADQPRVGVFLSGGIDSYLVAAHAAATGRMQVAAGTGGVRGDPRDETETAIERARRLGIDHTAVPWPERRQGTTLLDLLAATVRATEQPGRYENALLVRHLLDRWEDLPAVLLSGDMADVLFGDAYVRALERAERMQSLLRWGPLRRLAAAGLASTRLDRARSLAELLRMEPHDFRLYFGGLFRYDGAERLLGFDPVAEIQHDYLRLVEEARHLSRAQRYCLVHLRSSGQGSIDKLERLVSAAGADLVHPFLLDPVFRLGFALPPSAKYRRGSTKLVPRTLAARSLPAEEAWGRRRGFSAPRTEWILRDPSLREGVESLRDPGARVRAFVDPRELDRLLVASGRPGAEAHADLLWVLLSIEMWARALDV